MYFSLTKLSQRRNGIHHSAAVRNLICRSISPDSRHKAITQSRIQSPLGSFFRSHPMYCTVSKYVHCSPDIVWSPDIWSNQIYGPKWVPMYVYRYNQYYLGYNKIKRIYGNSVHFCWAILLTIQPDCSVLKRGARIPLTNI